MEVLGQSSIQQVLFFILYGITMVAPLMAAVYLLLRRSNAIVPGVSPPLRLRHWASAFFVFSVLTHIWWLLFYIYSADQHSKTYLLLVVLDCVLLLTTISGTMLSMLQDRRRPVWPALVAMIPFLALGGVYMHHPSELLLQIGSSYVLLFCLSFSCYIVFAIWRYSKWLNDNYADLENKKIWLNQLVAFLCMLLFGLYVLATDMVFICCIHFIDIVLVFMLLWRVETLQQLPALSQQTSVAPVNIDLAQIEQLLAERCVTPELYLQHDLTIQQLSQTVGTNRFYLSQYFSRQGITYNTYINNLRINHFISCYQELIAAGKPIVAQQLASESGYRSYSTFSLAFKQRTGQSVTAWMRQQSHTL